MSISYHASGPGELVVRGLSSDTKPTTTVFEGASFVEEDTGKHYKYESSVWVEKLNDSYGGAVAVGLKAPKASPVFTGEVTMPTPFTLGAISVTATGDELNFVDGVTSAIQTQFSNKADLVTGKVPSSQLPAIAITDTNVVASEAAQLALTAEEGDVAVRTDLNKSYIHNGGVAGTMADWSELLTPTDTVLSVNGYTGAVTLVKADVGLGNVTNTSDANKPVSTAQQTALDTKLSVVTSVSLTAQNLDISDTAMTVNTAGLYRIVFYLLDTTADVTAGAVTLNIKFTDGETARTISSAPVTLAAAGFVQGQIIAQLASGNLTYGVTHSGDYGTSFYSLYLTQEKLI